MSWSHEQIQAIWLVKGLFPDPSRDPNVALEHWEITEFYVKRKLNTVTAGDVTIAVGKRFRKQTEQVFSASAEELGNLFSLVLFTNKDSYRLFSGYVTGVHPSRSSHPVLGQVTLKLDMIDEAGKMMSMNPFRYHYFEPATQGDLFVAPKLKQKVTTVALTGFPDFLASILDKTKTGGWYEKPGEVIVLLAKNIQAQFETLTNEGGAGAEAIAALLTEDGSALRPAIVKGGQMFKETLAQSVFNTYFNTFGTSNVWQAVLSTANYMFLDIAQRGRQMQLFPSFYWKKTPDETLTAADVIRVTRAIDSTSAVNVVDAVAIASPGFGGSDDGIPAVYPDRDALQGLNRPGKALVVNSLPAYLTGAVVLDNRTTVPEQKEDTTEAGELITPPPSQQELIDASKQLGNILAKLYFASLCQMTSEMSIAVRWNRLDLLDKIGYVIQGDTFINPEINAGQFYGTLETVAISGRCSPTDSAALGMEVRLIHVRNKELQDKYALDENPIYMSAEELASTIPAIGGSVSGSSDV